MNPNVLSVLLYPIAISPDTANLYPVLIDDQASHTLNWSFAWWDGQAWLSPITMQLPPDTIKLLWWCELPWPTEAMWQEAGY